MVFVGCFVFVGSFNVVGSFDVVLVLLILLAPCPVFPVVLQVFCTLLLAHRGVCLRSCTEPFPCCLLELTVTKITLHISEALCLSFLLSL